MITKYEPRVKRLERLPKEQQLDITFDLINAITFVRSPEETALLLQDLLTSREVRDLGQRLRIAKLLIAGKTQREIIEIQHCSGATVAKVNLWLNQRGEGFKRIIKKLPKQYEMPRIPYPTIYNTPDTLIAAAGRVLATNQKNRLKRFASVMDEKAVLDRSFQEAVDEDFMKSKGK